MKDKSCWLCGVKISESMIEEYGCSTLCPECEMEAEDMGIHSELFEELY